jgi:hypothetical protein
MLNAAKWIIACKSEKVIALGKWMGEPGRPEARHVESVWVAPTHRRRAPSARFWAYLDENCRRGVTRLMLWVLEDDHDAQRA